MAVFTLIPRDASAVPVWHCRSRGCLGSHWSSVHFEGGRHCLLISLKDGTGRGGGGGSRSWGQQSRWAGQQDEEGKNKPVLLILLISGLLECAWNVPPTVGVSLSFSKCNPEIPHRDLVWAVPRRCDQRLVQGTLSNRSCQVGNTSRHTYVVQTPLDPWHTGVASSLPRLEWSMLWRGGNLKRGCQGLER